MNKLFFGQFFPTSIKKLTLFIFHQSFAEQSFFFTKNHSPPPPPPPEIKWAAPMSMKAKIIVLLKHVKCDS